MTNGNRNADDQAIDEPRGTTPTALLDAEPLDPRHSDALDFHEVPVWQLRKALRAAFEAGKRQA